MKTSFLILSLWLSAAAVTPLIAQGEMPTGPGMGMRERIGQRMQNLTPEEREKLKAAQEKAKQNPTVAAAMDDMRATMKDFRETMHAAMLAVDPSLQPILDKLEKEGEARPKRGKQANGDKAGPRGPGGMKDRPFENLTAEERQKVLAAREKVKDNPDVASSRERMMEAGRQFRAAEKNALLAADPSLGPILEKMEKSAPRGPGQRPSLKPGDSESPRSSAED